ncbi:hypothetical protein GIS00_26425 [Nakamurella sp. YIM 132087]|uniref:Uncharacterized protein n=1 Tax=Nakamurella alba TaxID=2665158 RepID=A0A7K1FW80_9ACTN|nr:hypothetical protein [Nakamurella alba]MTD17473.1 hypothetical protein [Nakamurella alba]
MRKHVVVNWRAHSNDLPDVLDLEKLLRDLSPQALNEYLNQDWTVVSHSIAPDGDELIISFLIAEPSPIRRV